jgi:hypothetical protein
MLAAADDKSGPTCSQGKTFHKRSCCANEHRSSKPSIFLANEERDFIASRRRCRKLLAYLIEQPRSTSIFVQTHRIGLAQYRFQMRHCHSAPIDFDHDLLTRNFAE